jgi:hypothetical protein
MEDVQICYKEATIQTLNYYDLTYLEKVFELVKAICYLENKNIKAKKSIKAKFSFWFNDGNYRTTRGRQVEVGKKVVRKHT